MRNNHIRKSLLVLIIILLLSACIKRKPEYIINGTVKPVDEIELVMLFKFRGDSIYSVDTTVIKQGMFRFKGEETLDDIAIVTTGNYPDIVRAAEVVLERGKIEIFLDSLPKVKGTPLNELYTEYNNKNNEFRANMRLLNQKRKGSNDRDKEIIRAKYEAHKKTLVDFYKENVTNPVGRRTFKNYSNNLQSNDIYQICDLFPEQYGSDPSILQLIKKRKELDEKDKQRKLLIGKKYTDFELMTPNQSVKKLSDYVGKSKFLYIEFWSSYCGPCIAEVPRMKKAYDNYKDKGFQLISISLDTNLDRWRNVIKNVDAPWIHLSDLKGDKSLLTEAYHIKGIPNGVLLDEEGTIVQVNLRGAFLEQILHNILGSS